MRTLLTSSPKIASRFIKSGEVAAFPTETVFGLGANVFDEKAIKKIFRVKGRPKDNPLIVHISRKSDLYILAEDIPETASRLADVFFPGPLTLVLKKHPIIPVHATTGLQTIAVRMPSSSIAKEFINECNVPIAAPSANLSGSPSPTSFMHVLKDFNNKIPCILIGPDAHHGIESTVVDCTVEPPVILRPGVITYEMLKKVVPEIKKANRSSVVKSPGQKYRHYAPKAKVFIVKKAFHIKKQKDLSAYIGIKNILKINKEKVNFAMLCKDEVDYAHKLFSFFRECDEKGINIIYAMAVKETGIGLAIMNRLKKASSMSNE